MIVGVGHIRDDFLGAARPRINEGFLSPFAVPLTLPLQIPLWQVAVGPLLLDS